MIIKRIVTIALLSSLALMAIILVIGLFVPTKTLERISRSKSTASTVVAVDKDGKVIEGATVQVQADGSTVVVDASGQTVTGASASAQPVSSTPSGGSSLGTTTPPPSGGTTTPPPTGGGDSSGGGTTTPPPTGGGTAPTPPTASLSASPTSIAYNASSTLTWSSANATSCSLSPGGALPSTSGSQVMSALTTTRTYTLTCTGAGGSVSKTATVTVGAAPAACGSPGGSCTAAQVATHNTAANCWVIYGGYYHIITSYSNSNSAHPGGKGAFTSSTCGQNITNYMNGTTNAGTSVSRKNHSASAYSTLNSYRTGPVN